MNARWVALSARFAALGQREKNLVCIAALAVILLGGYNLWIAPAQARKASALKQINQYKSDISNLGAQVSTLQARIKNPEATSRSAIADARKRLMELNQQLSSFDSQLVAPEKMTSLLQALLTRHRGLQLMSLQTLEPLPVIPAPVDKLPTKPGDAAKAAAPDAGNIYKHGIEIKVAGTYADLLAYMDELEHSSQHLLLGRMSFTGKHYPRVELSVTVYSLSLDRIWLVV